MLAHIRILLKLKFNVLPAIRPLGKLRNNVRIFKMCSWLFTEQFIGSASRRMEKLNYGNKTCVNKHAQREVVMDSINRNQTEHNHEDLSGTAAVEKIKHIVDKAESCFFSTVIALSGSCGTRPMGVQKVDDDGNIWFLSANDSHKDKEIAINPNVTLHFQGSAHSDFLVIKGVATASRDERKIKELWEPIFK